MAYVETLKALHERVLAAKGPDTALDFEIGMTLGLKAGNYWWQPPCSRSETRKAFVPGTASVDAALALVERVLPGCDWQFCAAAEGTIIYGSTAHDVLAADGKAATVPLAILAALLSALIAKETGDGKAA